MVNNIDDRVQENFLGERWNESYARFENTLFFPSEAVVRFSNKFIRRRIGIASYSRDFDVPPKVLEIGSGAGRHLFFLAQAGYQPTGVELSAVACEQARAFLAHCGVSNDSYEIVNDSAVKLPMDRDHFDYAISVATLDSMPTKMARSVIDEVYRVLKPGALFFVDLIGDDVVRSGEIDASGDQIVTEQHERGTVQSYYNIQKINALFQDFEIRDIYKMLTVSSGNKVLNARFYVTLGKPS